MTKFFVFDADHVLIHPPDYGTKHTLEGAGLDASWTPEFFTKGPFKICQVGKKDLKEEIAAMLKKHGWEKSVEDFFHGWFVYEHHLDETLLDKIAELREKGYICILASDQEKYRKQYLLDEMDFKNQFDGFSFSCDVGYLKEQPERFELMYQYIIDTFGEVEKHDIFFVDDLERNIVVAKAFGIDAVLYESTEQTIDEIEKRIQE